MPAASARRAARRWRRDSVNRGMEDAPRCKRPFDADPRRYASAPSTKAERAGTER